MSIDKSERYLKDIAKNTAEIAKELKRINLKPEIDASIFKRGVLGEWVDENTKFEIGKDGRKTYK